MSRIALWTTYFKPKTEERDSEFIRCLQINAENPHIDIMYILCENTLCPIESPKIKIIPITERPSFNTFFELYERNEPESINILINTDIVIDYRNTEYFYKLEKDTAFLLTRYEVMFPNNIKSMKDLETERIDLFMSDVKTTSSQFYYSYDLWAIRGYPSELIFPELLGVPACDGRSALHFHSLNYKLYNPCLDIHIYHIHSDDDRSYYLEAYKGSTIHIRPTNIAAILQPEISQIYDNILNSVPTHYNTIKTGNTFEVTTIMKPKKKHNNLLSILKMRS
jgi:hypothetical protein